MLYCSPIPPLAPCQPVYVLPAREAAVDLDLHLVTGLTEGIDALVNTRVSRADKLDDEALVCQDDAVRAIVQQRGALYGGKYPITYFCLYIIVD